MAEQIYEEFKDMNFLDYAETYEEDIAFINGLLSVLGEQATRQFLNLYWEVV